MKLDNRETWLNAAAAIMQDEIIAPNITITAPLMRYSMTTPTTATKGGRVLGECWNRVASGDGANEIFITANLGESDSVTILAVTLHEQMHAYDNNEHKHGPEFAALCRAVGLKGGPTKRCNESFEATQPTEQLEILLADIVDTLGPIPHAAMNIEKSGKPKQVNRNLKLECGACEVYNVKASTKVIMSIEPDNGCPVCGVNNSMRYYPNGAKEAPVKL